MRVKAHDLHQASQEPGPGGRRPGEAEGEREGPSGNVRERAWSLPGTVRRKTSAGSAEKQGPSSSGGRDKAALTDELEQQMDSALQAGDEEASNGANTRSGPKGAGTSRNRPLKPSRDARQ